MRAAKLSETTAGGRRASSEHVRKYADALGFRLGDANQVMTKRRREQMRKTVAVGKRTKAIMHAVHLSISLTRDAAERASPSCGEMVGV